MSHSIYGDEVPSSYRDELRRLRADLVARGVQLHPLDAEPRGVVNAAISRLTLMQGCWEAMHRLADYLLAEYPRQRQVGPQGAPTVDTAIHLLREYREVLRELEVMR